MWKTNKHAFDSECVKTYFIQNVEKCFWFGKCANLFRKCHTPTHKNLYIKKIKKSLVFGKFHSRMQHIWCWIHTKKKLRTRKHYLWHAKRSLDLNCTEMFLCQNKYNSFDLKQKMYWSRKRQNYYSQRAQNTFALECATAGAGMFWNALKWFWFDLERASDDAQTCCVTQAWRHTVLIHWATSFILQ